MPAIRNLICSLIVEKAFIHADIQSPQHYLGLRSIFNRTHLPT